MSFRLKILSLSVAFVIILTLLFRPACVYADGVIFEDNFDNVPNGQIPPKWSVVGNSGWQVMNGQYGILLDPGVSNSVPKDEYWNNLSDHYSFDVDLRASSGTDKNLVFHYLDPSNRYELHHSNGIIYLEKYTSASPVGIRIANPVNYSLENNVSYHFKIIINGDKISVSVGTDIIFDTTDSSNPKISGGKVGLRVGTGATSPTEVWYDNVVVTDLTTPTPPPQVSKVFFVPGFGASWNADAIVNCKTDNYSGNWSLASYAEDIYGPILTNLAQMGWDVKPFYYDWRKEIPGNSAKLATYINESIAESEKVNLIGHSMGGLIGRDFLKSPMGSKLDSLLIIGSPHKGSALAYPPWSGGDVWQDNFLLKIAVTLMLKRCSLKESNREIIQTRIPSLQNLLPTYAYLKDGKSSNVNTASYAVNTWLNNNPFANPWGVRVGTLSGTGYSTLQAIQVKPPTAREIAAGNWLDGHPNSKIYSTEGDGTVLVDSSKIEGVSGVSINQTHAGLVDSIEGMTEILKFLGTAPGTNLASGSAELKSALIVIGYPANFTLTDQYGDTKNSSDSMTGFINPKPGLYKLSLMPKSNNTLFIIAHFLSNGEVKYQEYNFRGLGPTVKTLKLDQFSFSTNF
jgi:hypothetical protein